ncbi:MAG: oligosaccharide flippase family protein [Roseovarius sp.]|nr:oligosaccharide flippase family protein [Roseovarius sp.]
MLSRLKFSKSFLKNIKWQLVANLGHALFGGIFILYLGRALGAETFGIYSILVAGAAIFGLLIEFRMQEVVATNLFDITETDPANHPTIWTRIAHFYAIDLASRLVTSALLLALMGLVLGFMDLEDDYRYELVLAAAAYLTTRATSDVSMGMFRVLDRIDLSAMLISAAWILRILFVVAIATLGNLTLAAVFWVTILVGLGITILRVAVIFAQTARICGPWRGGYLAPTALPATIRDNRRLLAANLGLSVSDMMSKDLDIVVLSSAAPPDQVGVYKIIKTIAYMVWRVIDPLIVVAVPEVQKVWKRQNAAELRQFLRNLALAAGGAILVCVLIAWAGTWLVILPYLGDDYAAILTYLPLGMIWLVVCAPLIWSHALAMAIGRPEWNFYTMAAGSAAALAFLFFFVEELQILAAIIAWSLAFILGFCCLAVLTARRAFNLLRTTSAPS